MSFSAAMMIVLVSGATLGDTLELANGTLLEGKFVGSSELMIEITDVMLNDQLLPISTGALQAQTDGEVGRTVGRTARAAAVGGLIGGRSGVRTGARVGAGASILTSGASINIPPGTILETSLASPLTVPQ